MHIRLITAFFTIMCVGMGPISALANNIVINFDDLTAGAVPTGYQGLTWGTSTDSPSIGGATGYWDVTSNTFFVTPHSGPNDVHNAYAVDNLWFSFPGPVDFEGAWFSKFNLGGISASQVRFTDNLGHTSAWLDLTTTPQFLSANFVGAATITVERLAPVGISIPNYAMDDITYDTTAVPEPTSLLLLGTGLGGLALAAWRRRK